MPVTFNKKPDFVLSNRNGLPVKSVFTLAVLCSVLFSWAPPGFADGITSVTTFLNDMNSLINAGSYSMYSAGSITGQVRRVLPTRLNSNNGQTQMNPPAYTPSVNTSANSPVPPPLVRAPLCWDGVCLEAPYESLKEKLRWNLNHGLLDTQQKADVSFLKFQNASAYTRLKTMFPNATDTGLFTLYKYSFRGGQIQSGGKFYLNSETLPVLSQEIKPICQPFEMEGSYLDTRNGLVTLTFYTVPTSSGSATLLLRKLSRRFRNPEQANYEKTRYDQGIQEQLMSLYGIPAQQKWLEGVTYNARERTMILTAEAMSPYYHSYEQAGQQFRQDLANRPLCRLHAAAPSVDLY